MRINLLRENRFCTLAVGFLAVGHHFEFQDAALRVAPEFPQTIYLTTSATSSSKNVAEMKFAFEETSYLAGIIAGAISKTGVIGLIEGTELPAVKQSFATFMLGTRTTNPNARTIESVIIDLPRAFLAVARGIKDGNFTPRVISLGLHDKIVRFVLNPQLESTIPARVRAQVDSARIALDGGATRQSQIR